MFGMSRHTHSIKCFVVGQLKIPSNLIDLLEYRKCLKNIILNAAFYQDFTILEANIFSWRIKCYGVKKIWRRNDAIFLQM